MDSSTLTSGRMLAAGVVVVALLTGAFVVVYTVTPAADRPALLSALAGIGPWLSAFVAAVSAALAGKAVQGNRAAATTADHVKLTLGKVEEQTNGDLDRRMAATFARELDVRGLVPRQRADDAPADVTGPAESLAPVEGSP